MKSERTVKRELRRLRRFIDENQASISPAVILQRRVAHEVECAIRWAREDIRGWPAPLEMAAAGAHVLGNELYAAKRGKCGQVGRRGMIFPAMLMIIVGPFVAFATNQPYTRSRHPMMSVLGAFAGGMMFMSGITGALFSLLP